MSVVIIFSLGVYKASSRGLVLEDSPSALLDLTCLLTTGRSSEGLMDYLGSGEHMSDRVWFHARLSPCS